MKTHLFYYFIILLFLGSCLNEDTRQAVYAGIYDTGFIYHEFASPLKVELTFDTLTDNYLGNDSIDIDQDGIYELFISQRIHLPPETGTPSGEHFPYYRLGLKNGLQVATKMESYYTGHASYNEINWVDTLNYEARIDNRQDWSESNESRTMWTVIPVGSAPNGPWYKLINEIKYIGIRVKIGSQYKYGWIKVNEISREDIQFLSFAIEN